MFDGSTGALVPPQAMSHNLTRNFTIAVWLKHEHHSGQDKHAKEHILCNADDHRNNNIILNHRHVIINLFFFSTFQLTHAGW